MNETWQTTKAIADAADTGYDTYIGGNNMATQTNQEALALLISGNYGRIQADRLLPAINAAADAATAGDSMAAKAMPSIERHIATVAIPQAAVARDMASVQALSEAATTIAGVMAAIIAERDFDADAAIAAITDGLANAEAVFEYAVSAIMDSVAIPDSQRSKLKIALIYQGGKFATEITGLKSGSAAQHRRAERDLPISDRSGYIRAVGGGNSGGATRRRRRRTEQDLPISDRSGYVRTDSGGKACIGLPRLYAGDLMPDGQTLKTYGEGIHDTYILSEDIARSVGLPVSLTRYGPSGIPGKPQLGLLWTWLDLHPAARDTLGIPADEWLTPVGYPRDAYPSVDGEPAHPSAAERIRAALSPRSGV